METSLIGTNCKFATFFRLKHSSHRSNISKNSESDILVTIDEKMETVSYQKQDSNETQYTPIDKEQMIANETTKILSEREIASCKTDSDNGRYKRLSMWLLTYKAKLIYSKVSFGSHYYFLFTFRTHQ